MKKIPFHLFVLLTVLLLGVTAARAEDTAQATARMEQRLGKLDAFKAQGVIGENNRGLVELRGGTTEAGDVVAAENRDRQVVYAEIAQKNGTTADKVGQARAKQVATRSAAGVWLQRENGEWYKK